LDLLPSLLKEYTKPTPVMKMNKISAIGWMTGVVNADLSAMAINIKMIIIKVMSATNFKV
jgi:hypothetical protein